jgi:N4-gp56 family major capsid protein
MAVYYDRLMLSRLRKTLVMHQFGETRSLPANSGTTVQWFRRTDLAANTTPLTEGTIPTAIGLSATSISAQLAQYGDFTQTSDLISMTSIDDEIEAAVDILSYRAALTLDTLDRNVLDAGTNVQFANAKGALSAVGATDVLTGLEVRKAARALNAKDVQPLQGNDFVSVVHPNNAYDLQSDTATGGWNEANTYVSTDNRNNGEIGRLYGVRFQTSTNVSFTSTGTSGSANVYSTHFLGKGAFGVVNFDGGVHTYVKKSGEQDTSNPLNQYATVGYKLTYANKMLDDNRQVTVKVGSGF